MTLQAQNDTLITIFGGSGFLGRHLVRALAKRHYRIRVAVRRPDLAGHLQPLGRVGQIHAVQANVRHAGSVEAAVRDADIVINLVGILFERGRQRFDTVQAFGAEQVALAAANSRRAHDPGLGDRRRREFVVGLRPRQGRGREGGAGREARRHDLPAVDHVRAGGRLLQQVRRDGAHPAGAAADRRRRNQIPAGVRRRRRRSHRARGRRRGQGRRDLRGSAGRRCGPSRS